MYEAQKTLEDMKNFMQSDMAIKECLIGMAPDTTYLETEEEVVKYSDKLFKKFKEIEDEFSVIIKTFNLSGVEGALQEKLQEIKNEVINCNFTRDAQKKLYQQSFSSMDKELLAEVKTTFVGYTIDNTDLSVLEDMIKNCKTVNELLHVFHSYVMNNEEILQSMPVIAKKGNEYREYTLYGVENLVAQKIFDEINLDTSPLGVTDIIGLENKTIMMIRDSGHALTIEIDEEQKKGKVFVKYFIPKICNVEKVNALRGVEKVDSISGGTNGYFYIDDVNNLGREMLDFIERVPTDDDIIYKDGLTFKEYLERREEAKKGVVEVAQENPICEQEKVSATEQNQALEQEEQGTVERGYFTVSEMNEVAKQPKISTLKRFFEKIKEFFSRSIQTNHDDKNNYDDNER
jgi:hypothetical protein